MAEKNDTMTMKWKIKNILVRIWSIVKGKQIARKKGLFLAFLRAFIHGLPQSIRKAYMDSDERTATLYFYFDGEIQNKDRTVLDLAETEFLGCFTSQEMEYCNTELIRIDEPEPIEGKGVCMYARKEIYSESELGE